MKQAGFVVVGVVLGFLLGGVGPRMELADLREALAEATQRADDAERKAMRRAAPSLFLPGVAQSYEAPSADEDDGPDTRTFESENGNASLTIESGSGEGGSSDAPVSEDPLDQFDLAADAQRVRAQQSREALRQQGDLDDDQMARVDDIVGSMNDELALLGDDVVDLMLGDSDPSATDMLGVSHDVTGVLYEAQLAMDDVVAESGNDVEREASEVWNHVDLDAFREQVEDLDAAGFGGPPDEGGGGLGGGGLEGGQ